VARVAGRQHGVIAHAQLLACGLTARQIAGCVEAGRLHPLHRGVYAVGHRALTVEGRFMAALLAIGGGAALSHGSAAVLWELLRPLPGPVDVTATARKRDRSGIRVHRSGSLDTTVRNRIPVTTAPRTLLDCATTLDDKLLRRAVRTAEDRRLVTVASLEHKIARCPGHHGTGRLAALTADGPTPTKSELEDMLLELMAEHGLPRPPRINSHVLGHQVDFYYPDRGLVIEADSRRHHEMLQARKADQARDAELEAAGLRVIRIPYWLVIAAPGQTVERIRRALADFPQRAG
jgi:very-short-patch-repair endonuclease